jgi:Xaa-Pro aminopeptidase
MLGIWKYLRGVDGFVVSRLPNVHYLTGFTGSSGIVIISRTEAILVTDFRYKEQAANEVTKGTEVKIDNRPLPKVAVALARKLGIKKLGFEDSASYGFFDVLKSSGLDTAPREEVVEKLRETKDARELTSIVEAVKRAESAFEEVKPRIRVGVTESSISRMLETKMKRKGCARVAFESIVASGVNSAMPHASVTNKKLEPGDMLTIDWGGEADGYYSDMTRSFLMGGGVNIARKKRIYNLVLKANKAAVKAARAGMKCSELDEVARAVIKQAGYGEYFGHSLGHGVGVEVHERPRISAKNKGKLKPTSVVTIEPGVYVPGLGGVRIEDMVYVGKRETSLLTSLPKVLEII